MGRVRNLGLLLSFALLIMLPFQNCNKIKIAAVDADSANSPYSIDDDPTRTGQGTLGAGFSGKSGGAVSLGSTSSGNYNLVFLIDVSGSITSSDMAVAMPAFRDLVAKYNQAGKINLTLVRFRGTADIAGQYSNYQSAPNGDLTKAIEDLSSSNGKMFDPGTDDLTGKTNYEAGLKIADGVWAKVNQNDGFKNVMYFFTDGEPNQGAIQNKSEMQDYVDSVIMPIATPLKLDIHAFGVPPITSSAVAIIDVIDNTPKSALQVSAYQDLALFLDSTMIPGQLISKGKLDFVAGSDFPDDMLVAIDNLKTLYGSFSMDNKGNWVYTLDPNNADLQKAVAALAPGAYLTDSILVKTKLGSSSATVSINIYPPASL